MFGLGVVELLCCVSERSVLAQLVGCVAVTDELQRGVRKTLAKVREVGIRQMLLVGGDKHAALATARHCGLLPSFDWSCLSKVGSPESRHVRSLGEMNRKRCGAMPNSGVSAASIPRRDNVCQSVEETGDAARAAPCRRCDEIHLLSVHHTTGDLRTGPPRLLDPGCLHGLVTNISASVSHWAVADAQILLQRCLTELAHYVLKDRRRLQSPSTSMWACECGTAVPRRRLLRMTSRRLSSVGGDARRVGRSFSQRSYSRSKTHFRREKCGGVHQGESEKENVGAGRRMLQQRSEVQDKEEYNVSISSLSLRRKLRVGRCFLRVFEDMWSQSRDHGQGICLLLDAASLSFFLSHKLLQVCTLM